MGSNVASDVKYISSNMYRLNRTGQVYSAQNKRDKIKNGNAEANKV